jgi:deazaflavin-dependent oxidoreductase (nitroreductase family)
VQIEHTGRVTGRARNVVLEVVDADKPAGIFYVVAAWGEKADWFRNIKANPQVTYQVGRKRYRGVAVPLSREDADRVFLKYGKAHPRLLQELMQFVGYRIERDETAYLELAGYLPVVRLSPRQEAGD